MNAAIRIGSDRLIRLVDSTVPEVRNRATINGGIEIGRNPGGDPAYFLAPLSKLDAIGLSHCSRDQYGLQFSHTPNGQT